MIGRYTLSRIGDVWTLRNQYDTWLDVELAALQAMEITGQVPKGTMAAVKASVYVDERRIAEIEAEIGHDMLAFIRSLEEQAGDHGRYIHRGLTSSDVKDTALSLQIKDSLEVLTEATKALWLTLMRKAEKNAEVVIIGRTHGMHAEPTTLGLKMLVWADEVLRRIRSLETASKLISVGKFSGPVGTYSEVLPDVEKLACDELTLTPATASNQVIQRDLHAEVMAALALLASTLEKIALNIRLLHGTDIGEVMEPKPHGSSSMPHKQNPNTCETVCGLARMVRANLMPMLENVALFHERDMTHSSVERVALPDSFILAYYMTVKLIGVIGGLVVNNTRIEANLRTTQGAIYSQQLLLKLVDLGMSRTDAHDIVRTAYDHARLKGTDMFIEVARSVGTAQFGLDADAVRREIEGGVIEHLVGTSKQLIAEAKSRTRSERERLELEETITKVLEEELGPGPERW